MILYYRFARCYYWGNWVKGTWDLSIFSYNCFCIYNYLKIQSLILKKVERHKILKRFDPSFRLAKVRKETRLLVYYKEMAHVIVEAEKTPVLLPAVLRSKMVEVQV